jgi:pseudouridylate synthase I
MRYKITIEYDGRNYGGWQRQKNSVGVQEVLEEKLSEFFGRKIKVTGSGRTDAGVHALGQAAHFDAETRIPAEKLKFPLNALLPDDIKIMECAAASEDFHAQYSAKRKTYIYKTYVSGIQSPTKRNLYAQILPPIDIEKMREAAKQFIGVHDFKAFSSSGSARKTTVREIYRLDIISEEADIIFEIEGSGFLYNMVRIIVGTLVYIGKGKLDICAVGHMFSAGDRKAGGKTMPAEGLYLKEVKY